MCETNEVEKKMAVFLSKYNPRKNVQEAINTAINVSIKRNTTYQVGLADHEKKLIKNLWRKTLNDLSKKYVNDIEEIMFVHDIEELRRVMNQQFQPFFKNGFRIAHAQKSLSVFLKIRWAEGKISAPPLCPVDAVILKAAGGNTHRTWTTVDDINDYMVHINILKEAAKDHPCGTLACWELLNFNPTDTVNICQ